MNRSLVYSTKHDKNDIIRSFKKSNGKMSLQWNDSCTIMWCSLIWWTCHSLCHICFGLDEQILFLKKHVNTLKARSVRNLFLDKTAFTAWGGGRSFSRKSPLDRDPIDRDPSEQRPLLDRDPPGQRPHGQRPPRQRPVGQRPLWTETPCGQTDTSGNITFTHFVCRR